MSKVSARQLSSSATAVTVKMQLGEEIRRVPLVPEAVSWDRLQEAVAAVFSLQDGASFTVKYLDQEGDLITIAADLDLVHFFSLHRDQATTHLSLPRLIISPTTTTTTTTTPTTTTTAAAASSIAGPESTWTPPVRVVPLIDATQTSTTGTTEQPSPAQEREQRQKDPSAAPTWTERDGESQEESERERESEARLLEELLGGLEQAFAGFQPVHQGGFEDLLFPHPHPLLHRQAPTSSASTSASDASASATGSEPAPAPAPAQPTAQGSRDSRKEEAPSATGKEQKLDKLEEMGFQDRALNEYLLAKNRGSLHWTLQDLLAPSFGDLPPSTSSSRTAAAAAAASEPLRLHLRIQRESPTGGGSQEDRSAAWNPGCCFLPLWVLLPLAFLLLSTFLCLSASAVTGTVFLVARHPFLSLLVLGAVVLLRGRRRRSALFALAFASTAMAAPCLLFPLLFVLPPLFLIRRLSASSCCSSSYSPSSSCARSWSPSPAFSSSRRCA